MNVALVTCAEMPEPDADEVLLQDAVRARGLVADVVPWDAAPPPAPEAYTLWVLRSPWNYHHHLDAFLAFAARVAARRTLLNPLHIVRWNARKTYLRDLKQRGVPVVPTAFVPRGGGDEALSAIARTYGWDDVVVKPVVSGGSFGTRRFRAPEFDDGQAFLHDLTATREAMVQGYVPDVEGRGERAVVFIDGMLTHAVRKSRRLAGDDEAVSEALAIADDERALAELALRPYRDRLLYGRVDMVRDAHGVPMVMELELLEPSLFLAQHPPALQRLADAIVRAAADAAR